MPKADEKYDGDNYLFVTEVLTTMTEILRTFIKIELQNKHGINNWKMGLENDLNVSDNPWQDEIKTKMDLQFCIWFITSKWKEYFSEYEPISNTYLHEIRHFRNVWAHSTTIKDEEITRLLDTCHRFRSLDPTLEIPRIPDEDTYCEWEHGWDKFQKLFIRYHTNLVFD